MALPEIRGTARLLADPRTGTTKADKPWTTALAKFATWRKADGKWEETEPAIAVISAYDDNAPLLGRYTKGDDIGVHGTCRPVIWNDKPQLAVTATQIWTPEKTSG